MQIRFTTVDGLIGILGVEDGPKSLDPRFDFVRSDEQMEAIENSRRTFAEAYLRNHMGPAFKIVADIKVVADPSHDDFSDLDLDVPRTTEV